MDSTTFFGDAEIKKRWAKAGIYVIEQKLLKGKNGKPMYKIGMAKNGVKQGITARLANYKTAYSTANPFLIHYLYEVPMGVQSKRPNFTYLTEARIHLTLQKMGYKMDGEWFYSLPDIINVIETIREEHKKDPVIRRYRPWDYEDYSKVKKTNTPVNLIPDSEVPSKLADLIALTTEEKNNILRPRKDVNYRKGN